MYTSIIMYSLRTVSKLAVTTLTSSSSRGDVVLTKTMEEISTGDMTEIPTGKLTQGLLEFDIRHIKPGTQHPGDEKLRELAKL